MFLRNTCSKVLKSAPLLLGVAFPCSSWAMMDEGREFPVDIIYTTARFLVPPKQQPETSEPQIFQLPTNSPVNLNLCNFRLVSKNWKEATDKIIKEDKLLSVRIVKENYMEESLQRIAPL